MNEKIGTTPPTRGTSAARCTRSFAGVHSVCAIAPSSPLSPAVQCAGQMQRRSPMDAASGGFTPEAAVAARHANTPELTV
jgi:hypothetical protein